MHKNVPASSASTVFMLSGALMRFVSVVQPNRQAEDLLVRDSGMYVSTVQR